MSSRVAPIVIVLIASALPVGTRALDSDRETFKSEAEKLQLIEKATASWSKVNRWLIEYEAVPSAASKSFIPVHKMMAVSSPGEYHHFSAHFPSGFNPWQWDPFWQETFIHQGTITHRWVFNRSYSEATLKAGDYMPGTAWQDVLLAVVPNWPLTDYKMPANPESGTPVILVDAVRSADFRLLANSEWVGGEECAVFDNKGIERIWIGANKGLCLMRHENRNPRSKKLVVRILTDKVAEVAPSLWLPTEFRFQFFRTRLGTNEDIMERESKISIVRCVVNNDVPDSTFLPVHRPGSIKYDDDQHFTQVYAGGEDLLSDSVKFMIKYAHLPTKPVPHGHRYAWLLAGLASGLCVRFFLLLINKFNESKSSSDLC